MTRTGVDEPRRDAPAPTIDPRQVAAAAAAVDAADAVLVTAGAGFGVDSGLPDFRGDEGFWRSYPALGRSRTAFTSIASPAAFRSRPEVAWGFYGHRLALYRRTVPHAGFAILRRWAAAKPWPAFVFTSNVDGQFQAAGYDPERLYECHGSIHHLQCSRPCSTDIWSADGFAPDVDETQCRLRGALPVCPRCGALARPNVLMFGDGEWIEARAAAQQRRLDAWLRTVRRPVVVELGAGTAVPSVRFFSERAAREHGGVLVRINPREPQLPSRLGVGLASGALDALRQIDAALSGTRTPR